MERMKKVQDVLLTADSAGNGKGGAGDLQL
jgi:hypothetical protein